jgi:uncharacterized protein with PIN domain
MSKAKIKELRILLQKYFGTSNPKLTKIKKPIPVKADKQPEKVSSLIEEIGKDIFGIRVKVEWGKCPYCDTTTQLLSLYSHYYRCSMCQETIRQYVNGHITYLPLETKTLNTPKNG